MKSQRHSQSGQTLIFVLITLLVGLSLALTLLLNSLTDLKVSTTHDSSERVFNAAEAGIEAVIQQSNPSATTVTLADSRTAIVGVNNLDYLAVPLGINTYATVNLQTAVEGNLSPNIKILWNDNSSGSCNTKAAILIDRWQKTGAVYSVLHYAAVPLGCPTNTIPGGTASTVVVATDGNAELEGYDNIASLAGFTDYCNPGPCDIMLRIRPIFQATNIKVRANTGGPFPIQADEITSTASDPVSLESRAVQVVKTRPDLPGIFDYVLYSGRRLVK